MSDMTPLLNDDGVMEDTQPEQPTIVEGGFVARLFLAPWDGRKNLKGEYIGPALASTSTVVAMILEFVFSFVLGFSVVAARRYSVLGTPGSALSDGIFIGAIHAIVWLIGWLWARDYNLKRFLNASFMVGRLFKFRYPSKRTDKSTQGADYGLLALAIFGGCQLGGAAVAGSFLGSVGLASLPNPTNTTLTAVAGSAIPAGVGPASFVDLSAVSPGLIWFIEFLGVLVIVLANLYTDERHQENNNNGGNARENERDNHARTGVVTALAIVAMTAALYPLGSYSFGPVPYFAGLVAVGTGTVSGTTGGTSYAGDPPNTPLIDWAHYLFTPVAAGAVAGLLGYFLSFILDYHAQPRAYKSFLYTGKRTGWHSAKTPLLRRQQQRPSRLVENKSAFARQRNAAMARSNF